MDHQELSAYDVDHERGFLPPVDPLERLPEPFDPWEDVASFLPKLLMTDVARDTIEALPLLDTASLQDHAELERAMMLLSYLGHGYVWAHEHPPDSLPPPLAVPWHAISERLGRPPVLSYASYALHNWRRVDRSRPIELGNIVLLQNFLGGADEEWFVLVHVDIEAKAAPAISRLLSAQRSVTADESDSLLEHLKAIAGAQSEMHTSLCRMPENCDPYIYYNRVRPYIHGWQGNPALPGGMIYRGVSAWQDKPRQFRGESGAQSTIIPSLDALLGIAQKDDPLSAHLRDMRAYMPPPHRAFLEAVEAGPSVREYVRRKASDFPELKEAYNECVRWSERFRETHLGYAADYIERQTQSSPGNPTAYGTAATPFMTYLEKHRRGTGEHLL